MRLVCTNFLLILNQFSQSYNKKFQGSGFFEIQYTCLHCARCDEQRNLTEVAKNCEKDALHGLTSFNAVEFFTNRKGIYNFLLVLNSKRGRISQSFRATAIIIGQTFASWRMC